MSRRKFEKIRSESGAKMEIRTEGFGADVRSQERKYLVHDFDEIPNDQNILIKVRDLSK